MERPPSGKRVSSAGILRPKSGTSRVLGRPLYRNPPQSPGANATDLTWADLIQNPSHLSGPEQKTSNDVIVIFYIILLYFYSIRIELI